MFALLGPVGDLLGLPSIDRRALVLAGALFAGLVVAMCFRGRGGALVGVLVAVALVYATIETVGPVLRRAESWVDQRTSSWALAGGRPTSSSTCADVELVLATIRTRESAGDYAVLRFDGKSTASGAYQYVDSTWQGYGGFARAADAPPEIQDERARTDVVRILEANGGDVAAVPRVWYVGAGWPADELDVVPMPEAGNTQTVRQYVDAWLSTYEELGGATACPAGELSLPLPASAMGDASNPHHDYAAADLGAPVGTPITAVAGGVVDVVTDDPGNCAGNPSACRSMCGLGVVVVDSAGVRWAYCHASSVAVELGQTVASGELLGLVGNTGHSYGPHLHLGVKVAGEWRCPQPLLEALLAGVAPPDPVGLPADGCSY